MRSRQTQNQGHSSGSRPRKRVSVPLRDLSAIELISSAWAKAQAIQSSSIATSALSDMAASFCRIGTTYRRRLHAVAGAAGPPTCLWRIRLFPDLEDDRTLVPDHAERRPAGTRVRDEQ